ncbi:MAG: hypothetical protein ACK4FP_04440 [Azonexus sp.]
MTLFLISALRAVIEMLGLSLIGQGALFVLAGRRRESNRIYQLFDLITRPPRRVVALAMVGASGRTIGLVCFILLFLLWLGLAYLRKFI